MDSILKWAALKHCSVCKIVQISTTSQRWNLNRKEKLQEEWSFNIKRSQTFWFTHSICCILQVAFSEHDADDEDGNGTGLIIRDITDTLENATDGLLAVAHTSGRARYF